MKNCEVLIIGAGPTGLTLAADLLKRGISVRIIEKRLRPDEKSRALGIQAGTLESLDFAFGPALSKQMIEMGMPARGAEFHIEKQPPIHVDFTLIPSRYNYVLILRQDRTEEVLAQNLQRFGGAIEWGHELISLNQDQNRVVAEIRDLHGKIIKVTSRFLVGCDGAHSPVRHQAGIGFHGSQYQGDFILGDMTVSWPFSHGKIRPFFSKNGVMACFPLDQYGSYRIILIPKRNRKDFSPDVDLPEFQKIASELSQTQILLSNPVWLTRFKLHHRMAERFRQGRVFIAGDAAHIHSPIGAQGMNTGIQDALNLSNKIALSFRGIARLDDYEIERMAVAKQVVNLTDRAFRLALQPETFVSRLVREKVIPNILKRRFIQKRATRLVSQVDVAREEMDKRGLNDCN